MKAWQLCARGLAGFIMAALVSQMAWAGEIKSRETGQQNRIGEGVESGQLTAREAAHLEKDEAKIESDRQKALADGKISPKEARKLNREENKESKKIYRKKHNLKKVRKPNTEINPS